MRATVAALPPACWAARARIQRRSASRFKYWSRYPSGIKPCRCRLTTRRSARLRTVRATSRAALVRVSPGTTNSRGSSTAASTSRSVASMPSTIAADTRVSPSRARSRASGFVASSAAATNSSRWTRRISRSRSPKDELRTPSCSRMPSSARARPRAATASSIVPYASIRRSSFGARSPPNRSPVVPSSPRPVATALSNGSFDAILVIPRLSETPSSPHQAGVAGVPALGQQGHLDVVLDDALRLLLDLLDHRPGVRAERRREDHLDLGLVLAEQDLLDQGELHDVHPDLGVDDGAQRVEDRELGRPPLGVERRRGAVGGRSCGGRFGGCVGARRRS